MIKKQSQANSLLDFLMHFMPDMKDMKDIKFLVYKQPTVDKKAVKTLMSIWKDESNVAGYRRVKRPDDITLADIELLEKEQLVRNTGKDELEITAKGVDVIKTVILGDERSSFEDDGKHLDYEVALANTKPKRKMVKGAKRASVEDKNTGGNWYKTIKESSDESPDE